MGRRSKDVTAYIAAAKPFARPILRHLRALYHAADPRLAETIKWGAPFFEHEGLVCSMSAFKAHVALGFWRGDELKGAKRVFDRVGKTQMAMAKVAALDELPPDDVLSDLVRQAVELNAAAAGSKGAAKAPRRSAPRPKVPADLKRALASKGRRPPHLRGLPAQRAARVRRVDRGRQAPRDPRPPPGPGRRVDGRGQDAQLEVPLAGALSPHG